MKKYNELIALRHKMSPLQSKVMNHVFNRLISSFQNKEKAEPVFELKLGEISENYNKHLGPNTTKAIIRELEDIGSASFGVFENDEIELIFPIYKASFNKKTKKVSVKIAGEFIEDAQKIVKAGYTTLPQKEITNITGNHTIQIYGLIKKHYEWERLRSRTVKPKTVTVEWLRTFLLIDNKYSLFSNFRRKILEKSLDEIKEKTELEFEYEYVKKGKSVNAVTFKNILYKSDIKTLEITENSSSSETRKFYQQMKSKGLRGNTIADNLEAYERLDLITERFALHCIELIEDRNNQKKLTKILAPTPWLLQSLSDAILSFDARKTKEDADKNNTDAKTHNSSEEISSLIVEKEIKQQTIQQDNEEWEKQPEKVKEAVKEQMKIEIELSFGSPANAYRILKNRIEYDKKNDVAIIKEKINFEPKGMSVPK